MSFWEVDPLSILAGSSFLKHSIYVQHFPMAELKLHDPRFRVIATFNIPSSLQPLDSADTMNSGVKMNVFFLLFIIKYLEHHLICNCYLDLFVLFQLFHPIGELLFTTWTKLSNEPQTTNLFKGLSNIFQDKRRNGWKDQVLSSSGMVSFASSLQSSQDLP